MKHSGNIGEVLGVSKGLDNEHKNEMKLKVIMVVGYWVVNIFF